MKLKEKLASEYSKKFYDGNKYVEHGDPTVAAYIAGFEKALEMAAEEAMDVQVDMDYEDHLSRDDQRLKDLDRNFNMACYEVSSKIKNLSEEEDDGF